MTLAESRDPKRRDPHLLTQLALTAWELEQEAVSPDNVRHRAATLRAHSRLQAEVEAVSEVVPDQRSQIRVAGAADEGVLLIHGSTGNPSDLSGLADHLYQSGYHIHNMLLPGHGTGDEGLPSIKWKSCYNEVLLRYRILAKTCRRVHVVGFSFGAALAMILTREEQPATLSLLSPALIPKVSFWARLMIGLRLHRLPMFRKKVGWNLEVFAAMEKAKGQAGKLKQPVYAAHCQDDDRIDAASLRHMQKKSRNKASRFRLYPVGGHMILKAHGADSLHNEVLLFLRSGARQRS